VLLAHDVTGPKRSLRAAKRRFRRLIEAFEDPANYRSRIWRYRKKSGDVIPVKITSFNLDFGGRRARLGVIEDLTERLQAEERAQESERRYRELLAAQGAGGSS
jgi:PAS domain S-box-containing protein